MRGKDLHRLESMPDGDGSGRHENMGQVAIASKAGHFRTMAVMIMPTPARNYCSGVPWSKDAFQQRMAIRDTRIEDADRWRILIRQDGAVL
jgi:hypothetical protein